jgi:biotin carboxyl carrier protein
MNIGGRELEVSWRHLAGNQFDVTVMNANLRAEVLVCNPRSIRLALDGVQREFRLTEVGDRLYVHSSLGSSVITRLPLHPIPKSTTEQGRASSPMPGVVLKILVSEGQQVAVGDPLLILEAMKMEQTIRATTGGMVESIKVSSGQVVSPGDVLVQISASEMM